MEGFSAFRCGIGYLRTGSFVGWFKYLNFSYAFIHMKLSIPMYDWAQISILHKKAWENPGFLELVKDEINRFGSNYSEALPSEWLWSPPPHSPQQSASAPPPQEANNPIEMIPRIESKYFMLLYKYSCEHIAHDYSIHHLKCSSLVKALAWAKISSVFLGLALGQFPDHWISKFYVRELDWYS